MSMKRKWPFPYLIIATRNENKLKQFANLFGEQLRLTVKGLNDFPDLPDIEEDRDTFEGNAIKKAEAIAKRLNAPVMSDDSGLVVPALGGEPGVYSARYAGPDATDADNNRKLMEKIRQVSPEERRGIYVCVMALSIPEEQTLTVRGECEGVVLDEPRGEGGFGYDPIFYLPSEGKTAAELPKERWLAISHRGQAAHQMMDLLQKEYDLS